MNRRYQKNPATALGSGRRMRRKQFLTKFTLAQRDLHSILQQDYLLRGAGDRLVNRSAWMR